MYKKCGYAKHYFFVFVVHTCKYHFNSKLRLHWAFQNACDWSYTLCQNSNMFQCSQHSIALSSLHCRGIPVSQTTVHTFVWMVPILSFRRYIWVLFSLQEFTPLLCGSSCSACVLRRRELLRCTPVSSPRPCMNWPARWWRQMEWTAALRSSIWNPWRWKCPRISPTGKIYCTLRIFTYNNIHLYPRRKHHWCQMKRLYLKKGNWRKTGWFS